MDLWTVKCKRLVQSPYPLTQFKKILFIKQSIYNLYDYKMLKLNFVSK